ncbi:beta-glucuronidase-like [Musca vetustissima]|uniref:beta-glucuronidase-like n=1 Tax=Musca vetustissima TaxID=27455 RepID=UPI002AB7D613|nr:beta-glucuronidase-like [Musca vetustissima]
MWRYLCIVLVLGVQYGLAGKLNNGAKSVIKKDPPLTQGLLYPFESESRDVRSLDGMWRFLKVAYNDSMKGVEEKWFERDLDKVNPTLAMPVPASYNDLTTDESLRDHLGVVWYERKFFASYDWSLDKRVWLRFGSVHYSAVVWLNGVEVVQHDIGHLPFEVEITDHLKFGAQNRLTVLCNNTLTRSTVPQGDVVKLLTDAGNKTYQTYTFDFFNYAGIHRSVVLYTTPKVYIQDIHITTDVIVQPNEDEEEEVVEENSGNIGIIDFKVTIAGIDTNEVTESPVFESYYLHIQLRAADEIVAHEMCKGRAFNGTLRVKNPILWWPYLMNPVYGYLYTLEIYLHSAADESLVDVYRMKVGIRKLQWDETSFLLNGRKVYLHGFGRHEDSDLRGKGLDYALLTRDFNLLKWIGANAYRTSHYPYSEESMQFADENGIMIIDECSSVNTDYFGAELLYNHKSALEQLIHRDRNHPSVIMWSIANEPRTQKNQSEAYFREIVRYAKTLDLSRPITAAINVEIGKDKLAQFLDIISFNRYNAWYHNAGHLDSISINVKTEATNWNKKYKRPIIMSEYGADTLEGLHSLPETIWSEDYQIALFGQHFKAFDYLIQQKWFIGEFVWNFADFKTEQAYTRVGGNKKGVFTRNRQPKSAAHLLRERYYGLCKQFYECEVPSDFLPYTINWRYRVHRPAVDAENCDSNSINKECIDFQLN